MCTTSKVKNVLHVHVENNITWIYKCFFYLMNNIFVVNSCKALTNVNKLNLSFTIKTDKVHCSRHLNYALTQRFCDFEKGLHDVISADKLMMRSV